MFFTSIGSVSGAVQRLRSGDLTLKHIYLGIERLTDSQLVELCDCLLARPDVATRLVLDINQLTDETGVKLAQYVVLSSTIECLILTSNQFGEATYLALAKALRVNTSLKILTLYNNQAVDEDRVNEAFVNSIRLNSNRPVRSCWSLCKHPHEDYTLLKDVADKLGAPSLLAQLDFAEDLIKI